MKRAIVFSVGAFGKRWYELAKLNGIEADLHEEIAVVIEVIRNFEVRRIHEDVHAEPCHAVADANTGQMLDLSENLLQQGVVLRVDPIGHRNLQPMPPSGEFVHVFHHGSNALPLVDLGFLDACADVSLDRDSRQPGQARKLEQSIASTVAEILES